MQIETKRFGTLDIRSENVVAFPEGLIGFPDCHEFVAVDFQDTGGSVRWLQAVCEPALGFVALDPKAVFPSYEPDFSPNDLELLDSRPEDLVMLSIVTVPPDIRNMTANLQAPIVISPRKRLGRQVITSSTEYTTKHNVFTALARLSKRTG